MREVGWWKFLAWQCFIFFIYTNKDYAEFKRIYISSRKTFDVTLVYWYILWIITHMYIYTYIYIYKFNISNRYKLNLISTDSSRGFDLELCSSLVLLLKNVNNGSSFWGVLFVLQVFFVLYLLLLKRLLHYM